MLRYLLDIFCIVASHSQMEKEQKEMKQRKNIMNQRLEQSSREKSQPAG
jgi:hypothetical protein